MQQQKSKAVNAVENIGRNGGTRYAGIGSKKPRQLDKWRSYGKTPFIILYNIPGGEMKLPGGVLVFFYGKTGVPGIAGFTAATARVVPVINSSQPVRMRTNSVSACHSRYNTRPGNCQAIQCY